LACRWRHVLAADVLVWLGAEAPEGSAPWGSLGAASDLCCPEVQTHLRIDPARLFRRNIDSGRLAGDGPALLQFAHIGGGGTEKHVRDMAAGLEREGVRALVLRPTGTGLLRLERFAVPGTPDLVYEPATEYYQLLTTLERLGVTHIHVQHLLGHPPQTRQLITDLGLPYDVTVHDYYHVCPRVHLSDAHGNYCEEPDAEACNNCLARLGDYHGQREGVEIRSWRERHALWLAGARKVFVPHTEVARRLRRYFPFLKATERRHFDALAGARPVAVCWRPGEPLRVILLGTLGAHKGVGVLQACARDASRRRLPLEFRVVGTVSLPELLAELNVTISGEYQDEEVFDVLEAQCGHCALFLSVVPETYSYTLSIAQAGGLYPVGLDLGALGARIRESGWGEVLPPKATASEINDRLLALRQKLQAGTRTALQQPHYESLLRDYYGLGWLGTAPQQAWAAGAGVAAQRWPRPRPPITGTWAA
jgi:hypothetical protein